MNDLALSQRPRIAKRIHDLLLYELGEDIDLALLLGPPEYARAVLSLCRGSGHAELVSLSERFATLTMAERVAVPALAARPSTLPTV
ncbi:MAG: hypothetical protein ABI574_04545 [Burkholderiales bacterium]